MVHRSRYLSGDQLLAYLLAAVIVVVAALLAFGLAAFLHLQGMTYILFVVILLVLGVAAAIVIIVLHLRAKKLQQACRRACFPKAELPAISI